MHPERTTVRHHGGACDARPRPRGRLRAMRSRWQGLWSEYGSWGSPFSVCNEIPDIEFVFLIHRNIDKRHVGAFADHLTWKRQVAQLALPERRRGRADLPFGLEFHIDQFQAGCTAFARPFQRHPSQPQIRGLVIGLNEPVDELRGQDLQIGGVILGGQVRMKVIHRPVAVVVARRRVMVVMMMVVVMVPVGVIMWHWTTAFLRSRHGGW